MGVRRIVSRTHGNADYGQAELLLRPAGAFIFEDVGVTAYKVRSITAQQVAVHRASLPGFPHLMAATCLLGRP